MAPAEVIRTVPVCSYGQDAFYVAYVYRSWLMERPNPPHSYIEATLDT